MQSIGQPDPYYILPILSALTTYIQSRQSMPPSDNPTGEGHALFHALVHWLYQLEIPGWSGSLLGRDEPHADWSAVLDGPGR